MIIKEEVSLDRLSVQAHCDMQGNIHAVTIRIDDARVKIHKLKVDGEQSVDYILYLYSLAYKLRREDHKVYGMARMYDERSISLYMEYSFI